SAPGVPELAEHAYFEASCATYRKTFHTWQYDREDFPYGIPQLMMGFTEDGQLRDELIHQRDRRVGLSTAARRRSRADIPTPVIQDGDRKSTRLNSSHVSISYAVFCLK